MTHKQPVNEKERRGGEIARLLLREGGRAVGAVKVYARRVKVMRVSWCISQGLPRL